MVKFIVDLPWLVAEWLGHELPHGICPPNRCLLQSCPGRFLLVRALVTPVLDPPARWPYPGALQQLLLLVAMFRAKGRVGRRAGRTAVLGPAPPNPRGERAGEQGNGEMKH
jgi:hypothetical protein